MFVTMNRKGCRGNGIVPIWPMEAGGVNAFGHNDNENL